MKLGKRILSLVLAAAMCCGMGFAVNGTEAEAASKVSVEKGIRCGIGPRNSRAISVYVPTKNDRVKNLKVYQNGKKTTNLVAKVTYRYSYDSYSYSTITTYAKKAGDYQIKFDVYKDSKTKRSSHTIKVHASETGNSALSKVAIDGTTVFDAAESAPRNQAESNYYTTKKSGKVKVTLAKGCSLKKINVNYYDKKGNYITKTVKNNKKINFNQYALKSQSNSSDSSYSNNPMWATTFITVYYTDKYSSDKKTQYTTTFYIYRRAK